MIERAEDGLVVHVVSEDDGVEIKRLNIVEISNKRAAVLGALTVKILFKIGVVIIRLNNGERKIDSLCLKIAHKVIVCGVKLCILELYILRKDRVRVFLADFCPLLLGGHGG